MLTTSLFGPMITSASVVISFTFLQYYFYVRFIEEKREIVQHTYLLAVSAVAGLLAMTVAHQVEAEVILDTRFVPVLLLLVWGRRIPALLPFNAALVIGMERFLFSVDGPAVISVLGTLLITALLSALNYYGLWDRSFEVRARVHVVLGNVLFALVIGASGLYTWQEFWERYALIILVVNLVATVIMVMVYEILYRDMRTRNVLKVTAETDFLTGLSNRRAIDSHLKKECLHARESRDDLSLALLDIDFFKKVNDTYGHEIGDQVLKKVAGLIRENVRSSDVVGRYGGEEFMIVFPHLGLDVATEIAERVRRIIAGTPIAVTADHSIQVTVSIGVATLSEASEETLQNLADQRLYLAKSQGRNRTVRVGVRGHVEVG